MPRDPDLAYERVKQFVLKGSHKTYWKEFVDTLIEPLGIQARPSKRQGFCELAQERIRQRYPNCFEQANWNSRTGPWTKDKGIREIIQIIEDLAKGRGSLPSDEQ